MGIDLETGVDREKLEKLAMKYGSNFLETLDERVRTVPDVANVITLSGANQQVIETLGEFMDDYFTSKNISVDIRNGGSEGYHICVSYDYP